MPDNRELARMVIELMNTRDFSGYDRYLAEDAAFDFPGAGVIAGRRRIVVFLRALLRRYPELHFEVLDTLVEGDRACVVWTNRGRRADGAPYQNRGVTLVTLQGGKISGISDFFKDTSFAESS